VRKTNSVYYFRVSRTPVFSPFALLFRHPHKTDSGFVQLVGTDPAEEDRNKIYLWPDVISGWEERRPCALPHEGLQRLHNNSGKTSNWPGSIPVPQEKRPQGRPPKPPVEKVEREVIRVPLERALVLKAMSCAAKEEKLLPQWIKGLVEAALANVPVPQPTQAQLDAAQLGDLLTPESETP